MPSIPIASKDAGPGETHTPGPWRHVGGALIVSEARKTELSSGRIVNFRVAVCKDGDSIEEVSANARLIAAAPATAAAARDMLAALEKMQALHRANCPTVEAETNALEAMNNAITAAKAAGIKVEG